MKLAFVYAGQGSQKVGMGKDFCEEYPEFNETMTKASDLIKDITDCDVKKLCLEGPMEELSQTRYTQPCMVAYAVGVTDLLKDKGIVPEYAMGLSLGEYSAIYAAESISKEDVIPLVAYRGKVMTEAVSGREVKMSAVLMVEREVVLDCCAKACEQLSSEKVVINGIESKESYVVQATNFNCPGQIVISGDAKAVDTATELLKEAGAKKIMPLPVSGPFHTKLMKPAGDKLREKLDTIDFKEPKAQIICNTTGKAKDDASFAEILEKQVQSSVYLEDSIRFLAEQGVDTIIEIGPGNTISKFVKKTAGDITVYSIDSVEDFKTVVEKLA